MYKNVIVPVLFDHDHRTQQSLEVATALADKGATITLLHVVEELPSYATQYLPKDHMKNALDDIKARLAEMAAKVPGAKGDVVRGHAARTILDYATSHDGDCIIVASHKPGVQDYFLGGTAARVVRYAQCAVHVVR